MGLLYLYSAPTLSLPYIFSIVMEFSETYIMVLYGLFSLGNSFFFCTEMQLGDVNYKILWFTSASGSWMNTESAKKKKCIHRAPAIYFHYHTSYVTWSYSHASSDICWGNTILHIVVMIQLRKQYTDRLPSVNTFRLNGVYILRGLSSHQSGAL
jgi:hypothetical protein